MKVLVFPLVVAVHVGVFLLRVPLLVLLELVELLFVVVVLLQGLVHFLEPVVILVFAWLADFLYCNDERRAIPKVLRGAQVGSNWASILKKRQDFRLHFQNLMLQLWPT